MKKTVSLWMVLFAFILLATPLSAKKAMIKWNVPEALQLGTKYNAEDPLPLPEGATSYELEWDSSIRIYPMPLDGYLISSITKRERNGAESTLSAGPTAGIFFNDSFDGATVTFNLVRPDRKESFLVNIENGARLFELKFKESDYILPIENGENHILFDPAIDKTLLIGTIGTEISRPFLFEVSGANKVDKYGSLYVTDITSSTVITLRAFEGDDPADVLKDVTIALDIPENMKGCVVSYMNWTAGGLTQYHGGDITVRQGSSIQLNLSEDFTYSKFTLGDKDITDLYNDDMNRIRFTVDESATIHIEGAPRKFGDILFTAYIMNPEGVRLTLGTYGGSDYADLSGGEPIASDITLGDLTMTKGATRKFEVGVNEKTPRIFISPTEGWYIRNVYSEYEGTPEANPGAITDETRVFYVIADRFANDSEVTFKVEAKEDAMLRLAGSTTLSANWGNPEHEFTLTPGTQKIDYLYEYDNPFSFRLLGTSTEPTVFIDGKLGTTDDNGAYPISLTPSPLSVVNIYADGTTPGMANLKVNRQAGIAAQVYYSEARRELTATSVTLLQGTPVTVVAGDPVKLTVNGESRNLEAGEETTIEATAGAMEIAIESLSTGVELTLSPAPGSTLKSLAAFTVSTPAISEDMSTMLYPDMEKMSSAALLDADGNTVATVAGMGEPAFDESDGSLDFPFLLSETVKEAGDYTLTLPAGAFVEVDYEMNIVAGGKSSAPLEALYTVDPSFLSPMENLTLAPASGSALSSLETLYIFFNELGGYDMPEQNYDLTATFTNGSSVVEASLRRDWMRSISCIMAATPDEDLAEGTWTLLIPEGMWSFEGMTSPEIKAEFTIGKEYPDVPLTPVPGSVDGNLAHITVTFPEAEDGAAADNAETLITLSGNGYSQIARDVRLISESPVAFGFDFPILAAQNGKYTLNIEEGAFILDEDSSAAIKAVYDYAADWVITPADGSQIEEVGDITVSFPSASKVEYVGGDYSAMLLQGGTYGVPMEVKEAEGTACPTFIFSLHPDAPRVPMGTIKFQVEEDAFIIDGTPAPAITASYKLSYEVSTDYTPEPATGKVLIGEWGCHVALIFEEGASLTRPDKKSVTLEVDGSPLDGSDYECFVEGNMLMVSTGMNVISSAEDGKTLTLRIAQGGFKIGDNPAPQIEENWTLVAPVDFSWLVNPADGAELNDLTTICVTFPQATEGEVYNIPSINLRNKDYTYYGEVESVEVVDDNGDSATGGVTFRITFGNPPTEKGEYNFQVYSGAFILDGIHESPEITKQNYIFDKDYTGISLTGIDGDRFTVHTPDGRTLLVNADAAALRNLERGIYIINGKKVFLK